MTPPHTLNIHDNVSLNSLSSMSVLSRVFNTQSGLGDGCADISEHKVVFASVTSVQCTFTGQNFIEYTLSPS